MISDDVKADVKRQEIKELVVVGIFYLTFIRRSTYLPKLEIQCIKQACIFHLILLGIP